MTLPTRLFAVSFAVLLAASVCAQEQPVPIEQEPMHKLKYANDHVRVFDVQLPPGYVGKFHIHVNDGVFINVAASDTEETVLGSEPKARPPRQIGQTYFLEYSKQPKTHRVNNIGSSTYRVLDVEILKRCASPARMGKHTQDSILVENSKVLVRRVILTPGQSARLDPECGVLVSVTGGQLVVASPDGNADVDVPPGHYFWRDAGYTVKNAGRESFHGVDILLK